MFVDGGGSRVLPLVHEHLDEFPCDAALLFLHGFLNARSGRADWQQEQFVYLTHLAPQYGDDWFFLGQYAFAHHAINRFEESRRLAEQSLARNPRCGHAVHSLAHVFYETNAHAAGGAFLRRMDGELRPEWADALPSRLAPGTLRAVHGPVCAGHGAV